MLQYMGSPLTVKAYELQDARFYNEQEDELMIQHAAEAENSGSCIKERIWGCVFTY